MSELSRRDALRVLAAAPLAALSVGAAEAAEEVGAALGARLLARGAAALVGGGRA